MSFLENNWTHDSIATNRVKLHYVTQGDGELMLFLHGFPEFWYSWRHQIPEFAKDHKVVALDLRGYNESEKPVDRAAYRMTELVEDVAGVIRGLGYDRCVLVGHDWGGAIAWNFAYAHPELLDQLVVLNLPHPAKFLSGLRMPQQLLKSWYVFFFQLPWLPEWLLSLNGHQAIATAMKAMALNRDIFTAADLEAYRKAAAKPGALTAMLNYYRNAFSGLVGQRVWDKLQVPTLLIWGEQDLALSKSLTYGTDTYVENLRLEYIANCSHWVQQEKPELVNQLIRDFVATGQRAVVR